MAASAKINPFPRRLHVEDDALRFVATNPRRADHIVGIVAVDDDVVREQIRYYRERAPEYDDWFWRRGRYDRGEDATRRWFEQVHEVSEVVRRLALDARDVLEIAAGTGIWTEQLCDRVAHLTAVDASAEMLELNRARLGRRGQNVSYVQADVFEWLPDHRFDAVLFFFWISHVPVDRLETFLSRVATRLTPGGTIFFLDARREPASTARDHELPAVGDEVMTRRLDDGREFSIVKNFWSAADLTVACRRAGLDVDVRETEDYFQFGVGRRGLPATAG